MTTVTINFELKKFLKTMFEFYKVDSDQADNVENMLQEYYSTIQGVILKKGNEYDYDHLWQLIKTEYNYKTTPTIPFILDRLDKSEKSKIRVTSNDCGKELVFIYTYSDKETGEKKRTYRRYTLWDCSGARGKVNNQMETLKQLREKYEDVKVRIFPKDTNIMGEEGKVYRPDTDEVEILIPENKKEFV